MLLILSCIEATPKETALIDSSNAEHELNAPDEIEDCSVSSIPIEHIETMRTCEPPNITVQDTWSIKQSQRFTYNFSQCWIGAIADFNRDGVLDIVCSVNMAHTTLYVVSGDGTGIIFESDLPMPHSPIAIADVDGDGWIELFALNRFGKPISFDHDGVINWRSLMDFLWTPNVSMPEPYCKTNLIISDPMSVGYPILSTFNGGVDASTGRIFLNRRQSDSSLRSETRTRITTISDLNQDGVSEIYDFKSQINWSGDILWDQSLPGEQFVHTWDIPIQADTDPEGELFVSTYPGMALYDTDGSLLAHTPISDMGDYSEPCAGDMDGDGIMEYIQPSRRGLIRLRQPDGSLILETDISSLTEIEPDDITFGHCSVFDFDMDGKMEAVVNYHGILLVINGTGNVLWHTPTNWAYTTPIVIDIDGDGSAEIINIEYGTNNHGGNVISYIDIYRNTLRNWPPGKRIWSGNAWTGVELFEDGSVPRHPAPSWTTTKLWRGEPAWSEEGADLAPEIVDSCETSHTDGKVRLSVRLQNLGPQDVPAGAPLAVYRIDEQGNKILDQILYLNTLLEAQMGSQSWELVFDKKDILGGVDLVAGDDGHGTSIGRDCDSRNNLIHYSTEQ